jgi:hypothetical protein
MQFRKDQWVGNKWDSIDIEPVDAACVLPLLMHLSNQYGFPMPFIINLIDVYAADFEIAGSQATLHLDTWTFSIAFAQTAVRDAVFDALQGLPEDFFC